MKQLSWKPIRRGNLYCAPACGRGCTMKEYVFAVDEARKLAKRLGSGWKVRIWENLGWHYSARDSSGYVKVHPFILAGRLRAYTAFLGLESVGGVFAESAPTPEGAIRKTRRRCARELNVLEKLLEAIQEA